VPSLPLSDLDRRFFVARVSGVPTPTRSMNNTKIAIRIGSNPNNHLWNNNRTWWLDYTEHLPDYTKGRVRLSLRTHSVKAARTIRDVLLTWDTPQK
jgi:hypothetical protein